MSEGKKFDSGKSRVDLIPGEALMAIGKVYGFGCEKYGDNNWRLGIKNSRLLAAALRHIYKHNMGETIDPESGSQHIAHAACNLTMLLWNMENKKELDDRFLVQNELGSKD